MVMVSSPFRPSDSHEVPPLEHEGRNAHADQVRAVDALEALGDHGAHAEQVRALGRPVARRAGAVFLAGENDERNALVLVAHGGVVDEHPLARGMVDGVAALDHVAALVLHHLVLDADIGEGAAHHDFVVAAPRAVLVEVGDRDLVLLQVFAGRRGRPDVAGRRDVVGGDRVAEEAEDARVHDVRDGLRLLGHALEIGRVLHIGRADVPVDR